MQTFLKKHIVGVIATVLLTVIVILSLMAFTPKQDTVKNIQNTSEDKPYVPEEPIIPYYESNIPKNSLPSEKYLYEQTICGNGDITLCDVLQTSFATYIIATTNCKSGDLYASRPTVGIIKTDSLSNVEKTYSLTNTCDYYYVASSISNVGIVVIATDKQHSYLYITITDYDLEKTETQIMSYAESVTIFPTADSFILFTSNGNENYIVKYQNELSFSTVNAGKVVDIFEYGTYIRIFYNNSSGYGITDLDKEDFSVIKELFVSNATLNCIVPLVENGKQIFLAVETEGSIYVRKYTDKMNIESSNRKKIGTAEILGHGTDGNNIYLCLSGDLNGVLTVKKDLSYSYSVNKTETVTSKILDFRFGKSFSLLVIDADNKLALIQINNESSNITYFSTTNFGLLIPYSNDTVAVICNTAFYSYSAIAIYGVK